MLDKFTPHCSRHAHAQLANLPYTLCIKHTLFAHSTNQHCQARLELEVQRQSGELTACERKLELLGADLSAERDRVAAQAALLERKVRCV